MSNGGEQQCTGDIYIAVSYLKHQYIYQNYLETDNIINICQIRRAIDYSIRNSY